MREIRNLPNTNQNIEIIAYRASIIIPIIITVLCTVFDLLSKWRIQGIDVFHIRYVIEVVVSYFFPSILASSLGLMWIHYFGSGYSGIKEGKGVMFSVLTGVLAVVHMIYLFLADTWFVFLFIALLVLYLIITPIMCMENVLIRSAGLQRTAYDIRRASGKGD